MLSFGEIVIELKDDVKLSFFVDDDFVDEFEEDRADEFIERSYRLYLQSIKL